MYFTRDPHGKGGRFNFKSFETEKIDELIWFMEALIQSPKWTRPDGEEKVQVMATGGGAYKYAEKIQSTINVRIQREDEMECLIGGAYDLEEVTEMRLADWWYRFGFLFPRDPSRGFHLHRRQSNALFRVQARCVSLHGNPSFSLSAITDLAGELMRRASW